MGATFKVQTQTDTIADIFLKALPGGWEADSLIGGGIVARVTD
jgi:hypothetical protein